MAYTQADLYTAELHIMQAERSIARQKAMIQQLEDRAMPAATARTLLATFEGTLITLQRHRDNIAAALGRQSGNGT